MRVKLCAQCPYTARDLADYYDVNSSSHLCFRCDSKRAAPELAIEPTRFPTDAIDCFTLGGDT
jgi:hypothetical protein